jgi:hypothetical protein
MRRTKIARTERWGFEDEEVFKIVERKCVTVYEKKLIEWLKLRWEEREREEAVNAGRDGGEVGGKQLPAGRRGNHSRKPISTRRLVGTLVNDVFASYAVNYRQFLLLLKYMDLALFQGPFEWTGSGLRVFISECLSWSVPTLLSPSLKRPSRTGKLLRPAIRKPNPPSITNGARIRDEKSLY